MSKSKFTTCETCGRKIAKTAKVCPHCGAPVRKKFYKRFGFWFMTASVAAGTYVYKNKEKIIEKFEPLKIVVKLYNQSKKNNNKVYKGVPLPWKK